MTNGVELYNKYLFGGCYKSTVIKQFNNAPGLPGGGGGIDADAAARLGYKNIHNHIKVAGSNKKNRSGKPRVQGICCGITAGWMVAMLGGNSAATKHDEFKDFFMGPLRFQGGYVADFKANSSSIKPLLDRFGLKNSNKVNAPETLSPDNIASFLPPEEGTWAGYVAAYSHAIGIGYRSFRYYIMEPNGGLFEYQNKAKFVNDLRAFLEARRNTKPRNAVAVMKVYFYTA
jgi:hypothetical protein